MKPFAVALVALVALLALAGSAGAKHGNPPPTSSPPPSSAPAALTAVTVNPTDVLGGTPVTGTVRLTAAAPAGGFTVALSSDDPAAATVQPSITVPAGARSASFPVTTFVVPNPQSALIIGEAGTVRTYGIVTVW